MSYILGFKQTIMNFKIEDGYTYTLTLQGSGRWESSNSNITDGEMEVKYNEGSNTNLQLTDNNEPYLSYINVSGVGDIAIILISKDRICMIDMAGDVVGLVDNGKSYCSVAPKTFEFNKNIADIFPEEAYIVGDYNTNKLNTFIIKKVKK